MRLRRPSRAFWFDPCVDLTSSGAGYLGALSILGQPHPPERRPMPAKIASPDLDAILDTMVYLYGRDAEPR